MNYKKSIAIMAAMGAITVLVPTIALAQTTRHFTKPAAMGTVASISGNTISLTGTNGTVYTIDASNATVDKITPGANGVKPTQSTITVAQIQTGDNLIVQGTANGTSITATKIIDGMIMRHAGGKMMKPAVFGTVSAVSGSSISVSSKNGTTYTVDATNAKINKFTPGTNGAKGTSTPITVSQIQTGDTVVVAGTITGSNVAATQIMDGTFPARKPGMGTGHWTKPAAAGKVASVSGNTITLTGMNNTTYTVDATNAAITKFTPGTNGAKGTSATITVSQVAVGDMLVVQGTANGTTITATTIRDGMFGGGFHHGFNKPAGQ